MTRQFVTRVTVTGADDSTKVEDVIRIQQQYPFVEFGILLSANSMGMSRFPTKAWIERLRDARDEAGLTSHLSAHICGRWVRQLCADPMPEFFRSPFFDLIGIFDRVQLNFHAQTHAVAPTEFALNLVRLAHGPLRQIILQYDGVNTVQWNIAKTAGPNVAAFHDVSHGAGILPDHWPAPIGNFCGYGGGLSWQNVGEQIELIDKSCHNNELIWVDAEGRLRSPLNFGGGYDFLDFELVEGYVRRAAPYVIGYKPQPEILPEVTK